MADIPCGDKILEYLVVPALKKSLRPIFYFQTIVDDFKDQSKKLSAILERVENDVHHDTNNAQLIYQSVENWLKEVNEILPQVQRVESELKKNKSCCCFRYNWCPNWTCHYKFSKQVSKITPIIKALCEDGDLFSSVSHPPTLHQDIIGSSTSVGFVHSKSSKSALNQIMEALKSDEVNLIGLYGGVGTGKTTLAEQVSLEAKHIFPHIIMVPVSQNPQVTSIQGLIADFLSLSLEHLESDQARATTLQLRLKKGGKILIILDDVGKDFNLGAVIGIPSAGCKVLFTMAHAEIQAPNFVHTQKDIKLATLSEKEAWTLFETIVGEVIMHDVAKDVLAECHGIPKAIVVIATALKGKSVPEWGETLQQLKDDRLEIIQGLKREAEKLRLRQESVKADTVMANNNVEVVYEEVAHWLQKVDTVMLDLNQFVSDLDENKFCFDKRDATTKIEKLTSSVKELFKNGNFQRVSYPDHAVQDMGSSSLIDFIISASARSALRQIMEAWETDNVKVIGLYGMGGIGKTTLANQVQNEVRGKNMHVIMVTVSQKPDVRLMQDKFSDFLSLKLEEKTVEGRARKLSERLKKEKILIILDDVWRWLDLTAIGITLDDCKGCKVLVTTRRKDVCTSMNCQLDIQLQLFSKVESQNFFKKKAGLPDKFELDEVAEQIIEECDCLPIALETVGAALRKKGKDEWSEALEKLRNSKLDDIIGVDDDEKNAYACVRVSYDYLKGSTQAQFILLLCSLFPEDYKIEVEDLSRYAFGMKLFERVKSVDDARRKVRVTIRFLKDSCMLLDNEGEEYVKLHDVVRDTLLWIGGTELEEKNVLIVRDGTDLKDLFKKNSFKNCRAVSFMPDSVPMLSKYDQLECPKLEIVLIFCEGQVELQEAFFEQKKALKVLDFRGSGSFLGCNITMPQQVDSLEHLRALLLRYCECSNSSKLGELGSLRILSLSHCEMDCEVRALSGLRKLRLLDMTVLTDETRTFESNEIEALVKLEELHGYTFTKCSSLSELKSMSKLVALTLEVEDMSCLSKEFCLPNLGSYCIRIGYKYRPQVSTRQREERCLMVRGSIEDETVMINTCSNLLPTVQDLYLDGCNDLHSLSAFNSGAGWLQKLETLEVDGCKVMEWLFESTVKCVRTLKLMGLNELKQVWKGPTGSISLSNLTEMDISNCSKLECVFSSAFLVTSLQQLQTLKIANCPNLVEIFSTAGFSCCCCFTNLRQLQVYECEKLKTIFPIVKAAHPQNHCCLPKLQRIVLNSNGQLDHVFGDQTGVECPSLQAVVVKDCPEISTIHFDVQEEVQEQLQRGDDVLPHNAIIYISSSLKELELRGCSKWKQVFTASLAACLHQLESLIVKSCCELEQVISKVKDGEEEPTVEVCFENLKTLEVSKCSKLKTISPISVALLKLETFRIRKNAQLEHVFGTSDWDCSGQYQFLNDLCVVGCPKLRVCMNMSSAKAQTITLMDIKGVEGIMQIEGQKNNDTCDLEDLCLRNLVDLKCIWRGPAQSICFDNLYRLEVIGCNKLKHISETTIATTLPRLEYLTVERCNELEQVIVMTGDVAASIVFGRLTTLVVRECGKLKTIFPISATVPDLKVLELEGNAELEHLFALSDWDCTWQSPYLAMFRLVDCPKMCMSMPTTKEMNNKLRGQENSEELECLWRRPTQTICLVNLYLIRVIGCKGLKHIYAAAMAKSLPNLEDLVVLRCDELEQLIIFEDGEENDPNELICFKKLEVIHVSSCDKLKTIFSVPVSLPRLDCLRLESNAELESLFGQSDSDYTSHWTRLKELSVTGCPKLNTQSVATLTSQLQARSALKHLKIINLSDIQGVEELVQFQRQDDKEQNEDDEEEEEEEENADEDDDDKEEDEEDDKEEEDDDEDGEDDDDDDDDDDDEDEDEDEEEDYDEDEDQILKLEEIGDLKRIWNVPTKNISFSFLAALKVIGCNKLKQVFTTTMAMTLHSLKVLWVERCHDLEQVIQEEAGDEDNNLQQLVFHDLEILRLIDLPKLISFSQPSRNLTFTHLREKNLKVEGCPEPITEFFSKQSYNEDEEEEEGRVDGDNNDSKDESYYKTKASIHALLGAQYHLY